MWLPLLRSTRQPRLLAAAAEAGIPTAFRGSGTHQGYGTPVSARPCPHHDPPGLDHRLATRRPHRRGAGRCADRCSRSRDCDAPPDGRASRGSAGVHRWWGYCHRTLRVSAASLRAHPRSCAPGPDGDRVRQGGRRWEPRREVVDGLRVATSRHRFARQPGDDRGRDAEALVAADVGRDRRGW